MPPKARIQAETPHQSGFDFFRISHSKREVDLSPNTVRAFAKEGLRLYRSGKITFVSKTELGFFIRNRALNKA